MQKTVYILIFLVGLISCSKTELIGGNQAPPDTTIEDAVISQFLNRTYISLLGREPDSTEASNAFSSLRSQNLSTSSRTNFIQSLQGLDAYVYRFYEKARIDLLNGVDTLQINQQINAYYQAYNQTQNQDLKDQYYYEMERLLELRDSDNDLISGQSNQAEVYVRCLNNAIYDEINMGADNFVISAFQYFLFRYPTTDELEAGRNMVNGFQDVLFLQAGSSKGDFLTIFFNHNGYYEGQVRHLFNTHLFRAPSHTELTQFTGMYKTNQDYAQLERSILSLEEYAGI